MFNFFKRKSPVERLEARHRQLLEEAYRLSHVNRAESDRKYAEAAAVEKEIEALNPREGNR